MLNHLIHASARSCLLATLLVTGNAMAVHAQVKPATSADSSFHEPQVAQDDDGVEATLVRSRSSRYAQGHADRVQQRINSRSPGVSREIAPDSKQSATGGQPGGLPGTE